MKASRIKIIVVCGILILFALVVLFIWRTFIKPPSESKKISAEINLSTESSKSSSSSSKVKSTLKEPAFTFLPTEEKLNATPLPIPSPNINAISKEKSSPNTIAFFEKINNAVSATEKSITSGNAQMQNISTTTPAGIILFLTEDQFHFLYPKKFISDLIEAQNLFIKEYDTDYETLSKIETDAQVRFVEEKIIATLLSANLITKERAKQLTTTIRFTLPQLQLIDLKSSGLYKPSSFSEFLNVLVKTEPPKVTPKRLFLLGLAKELANTLVNNAQAACGSCSSSAECFQEGASIPAKGGTEQVKFACHCTGCLTSLGCLSSCSGQAAIFDQATGICGCGLGEDFDFR